MSAAVSDRLVPARLDSAPDRAGARALFELAFDRPCPEDLWAWKYGSDPPGSDPGEPRAFVAREAGRIVAHVGLVPLRGRANEIDVPFWAICDVMVHPDHRVPAVRAMREAIEAWARRRGGGVLYGVADTRRARLYRRIGATVESAPVHEIVLPVRGGPSPPRGLELEPWEWSVAHLDEVWASRRGDAGTGIVRDGAYLRWRYRDHPTHGYTLLGVISQGAPAGWIVTQDASAARAAGGELRVLDCVLSWELLAPALLLAGRRLGASAVVAWPTARRVDSAFGKRTMDAFVVRSACGVPDAGAPACSLGEVDEWWW